MNHAKLNSGCLGGVEIPSAEALREMHESPYILRAGNGVLDEVPVEKVLLPHENNTSPQAVELKIAPNQTLYCNQAHIISKSTDGGRSWSAHDKAEGLGSFEILPDGTFITLSSDGQEPAQVLVFRSRDEGRTYERIADIENPSGCSGGVSWIHRLLDGVLLAGVAHSDHVFEQRGDKLELISGCGALYVYRSYDEGLTWTDRAFIHDWFSEGGVIQTTTGKLLAAMRYQRPTLPDDDPEIEQKTGTTFPGWPYKHVCLIESEDGGESWMNARLLVSHFGQTRGHPVGLKDGVVAAVHDTRYGPGPPGSRVMVSRDEGITWQDEVYYLDATNFTGSYAASVALKDDMLITVTASSKGKSWDEVSDDTDCYAIRWKLS